MSRAGALGFGAGTSSASVPSSGIHCHDELGILRELRYWVGLVLCHGCKTTNFVCVCVCRGLEVDALLLHTSLAGPRVYIYEYVVTYFHPRMHVRAIAQSHCRMPCST